MIRVPKYFFNNLSSKQYREYLKLLPDTKDKKTRYYAMLGFTLAALSFFGIFAINPTLSTITELKRKIEDLKFIDQRLKIKIQNLTLLQDAYRTLSGNLPVIFDAMPLSPAAPKLLGQINTLLSRSNLDTLSLKTSGIQITPDKKVADGNSFFIFSLEATGKYEDILAFIQSLSRMNRLITIEMISIGKNEKGNILILNLQGKSYFKS